MYIYIYTYIYFTFDLLSYSLNDSLGFFWRRWGTSILSANTGHFLASFPVCIPLLAFPYLIRLEENGGTEDSQPHVFFSHRRYLPTVYVFSPRQPPYISSKLAAQSACMIPPLFITHHAPAESPQLSHISLLSCNSNLYSIV